MKKDMKKNSINCINCDMGCNPSLQEKGLCPLTSTSILCNRELLKNSTQLELICSNEENEYYLVKGENTVIMHVEEGFCILVDYEVPEIVDIKNLKTVNMPMTQELCKYKYTMQRMDGRDCVVRNKNQRISYDIMKIRDKKTFLKYLKYLKRNELTIDYRNETYDERLFSIKYEYRIKELNMNNKSHHVRVEITSMDKLDDFIDDIKTGSWKKIHMGLIKDLAELIQNMR